MLERLADYSGKRITPVDYPVPMALAICSESEVDRSNCGKRKMNRPWRVRVRFGSFNLIVRFGFGCQTIWVLSVRFGIALEWVRVRCVRFGFGSIPISAMQCFENSIAYITIPSEC